MNQFDIFSWQPPDYPEPHPSIVISHPDRASNKPWVELIVGSTKRATRQAHPYEIILDQADGLDWPTLCRCDMIWAAHRSDLKQRRGQVTDERQAQLVRTIIAAHGWSAIL
ncbi:MAG: PemK-like, MazF-like toxin of type toxin-antitoxin system [Verrucomicrobiota bacterium]